MFSTEHITKECTTVNGEEKCIEKTKKRNFKIVGGSLLILIVFFVTSVLANFLVGLSIGDLGLAGKYSGFGFLTALLFVLLAIPFYGIYIWINFDTWFNDIMAMIGISDNWWTEFVYDFTLGGGATVQIILSITIIIIILSIIMIRK